MSWLNADPRFVAGGDGHGLGRLTPFVTSVSGSVTKGVSHRRPAGIRALNLVALRWK